MVNELWWLATATKTIKTEFENDVTRLKGVESEEFQLEILIKSVINTVLNPNECLLVILKSKMIFLCQLHSQQPPS